MVNKLQFEAQTFVEKQTRCLVQEVGTIQTARRTLGHQRILVWSYSVGKKAAPIRYYASGVIYL